MKIQNCSQIHQPNFASILWIRCPTWKIGRAAWVENACQIWLMDLATISDFHPVGFGAREIGKLAKLCFGLMGPIMHITRYSQIGNWFILLWLSYFQIFAHASLFCFVLLYFMFTFKSELFWSRSGIFVFCFLKKKSLTLSLSLYDHFYLQTES